MGDNAVKDNNQHREDSVFMLRIQFRRNTSWQGTVQSMNSRKTCIFRSVLELGSLIYEERAKMIKMAGGEASAFPAWVEKEEVS